MIITKILGGLGNQMFQYAMGRSLSIRHETDMKFEILGLEAGEDVRTKFELGIFQIPELAFASKEEKLIFSRKTFFKSKYLNQLVNKLSSRVMIVEMGHFPFNQDFVTESTKNSYIRGLWQSELYFKDIEDTIRKDFQFKKPLDGDNLSLANWLNQTENSVSIHIRRGDYVSDPNFSTSIGACDMSYYVKAIAKIEEHITNPEFIVFSDEIEWAKENLPVNNTKAIYVDYNIHSDHYRDMQLMSLCKHNIIANSTFSWWGAWLNSNKNKIVIAPKKWFAGLDYDTKDLIPKNWIKL